MNSQVRGLMRLIGVALICFGCGIYVSQHEAKRQEKKRSHEIEVEEVTPLQAYLNSIDGLQILFFTRDNCTPCAARERDTLPWMRQNGWKVETIKNDHDLDELFGISWHPVFVAVRNHRVVATSSCAHRRDALAFLRAAKADSLDHVGVALATHLNVKAPPAGVAESVPIGSGVGPVVGARPRPQPAEIEPMPLLGFPFGPSLSLVDVLQRYAGQEYEINRFAKASIPKGIKWRVTKQKDCMHLDIEPPPVLKIFGREVARCTAIDLSFDEIALSLDGFPDFSVPILW